jgi:phage baseplate assembly protein V
MAGSDHWINQLERWIAPWKRRILSMIGKCIISAVTDNDNLQLNKVTYLSEEVLDDIERVQEFGFTSNPPSGSEGVIAFIGGNQQHGVIIATDSSTYRLKNLPEGAVALYNSNGDFIKLEKDKMTINVKEQEQTSATKVVINAPKVILGTSTDNPLQGVVTKESLCAFTGAPHPDGSLKVQAAK